VSGPPVQLFQRDIRAPRARVYAALTTPADYQRWMVPDNMTSHIHELDARPGGRFRVSLTYHDESAGKTGAHTDTYHGVFRELVPNERVVQTMEFETSRPEMQGTMTITFALMDDLGGTRLSARHEGLPRGVKPADNQLGWSMALKKLAALCSGSSE
jgi:uncharacterized protein YndB with AHSA1/START domain